ncbi:DUF4922 domain-containing protein [Endozoicomonas numazuensis]|uniref:Uncharacterized protein n=1 Tax=Endozoicomonas numazuensis TaxID=1137799 RepID=A0A081NMD0_9GAMM|nr:DUF4922 domain-containing protein [Endozoicomonas numazuensis]KEQ19603.1 hypothetical protein GZ78_06810 [Endozoicomonas numazuensis]
MNTLDTFIPGTLWNRLSEVSDSARSSGHLKSSKTEVKIIQDGLAYEVRILSELRKKPNRNSSTSDHANPFLPFDPAMHVADLNTGHVLLLNKFNVVDNHYLIITQKYEDQEEAFELKEFEAVAQVLPEFPQLVFYNSGRDAGASQPHRHLQSLPIDGLPIDPALTDIPDNPARLETLPYEHLIVRLNLKINHQPEDWLHIYQQMIDHLKLRKADGRLKPYNFLMTDQWMMIIPRTEGRFESISVNALGFAGLLLVKNRERFETLLHQQPSKVLSYLTRPS